VIRTFIIVMSIAISLGISSAVAYANNAVRDSCHLIDALVEYGSKGAVEQLASMTSNWPSDLQENLNLSITAVFDKFKFIQGKVFLTANFGNLMQEHLLVLDVTEIGVVYVRIVYEQFGESLKFSHITIEDKYEKLIEKAFAQPPELLACGK